MSWRKSRFSGNGPNRVEVGRALSELRDSKNASATVRVDVRGLVRAIKAGRL